MVTGDQLTSAKETSRRLGLSNYMYPAKVLKDRPAPSSKRVSLDKLILDADGLTGVFPKHYMRSSSTCSVFWKRKKIATRMKVSKIPESGWVKSDPCHEWLKIWRESRT